MVNEKIDITPRWVDLCAMVERGALEPRFLRTPCDFTDRVREHFKAGAKKVVITQDKRTQQLCIEWS